MCACRIRWRAGLSGGICAYSCVLLHFLHYIVIIHIVVNNSIYNYSYTEVIAATALVTRLRL